MELNFKLSAHYTSLGEYGSTAELVSAIETMIEESLENKMKTELGVALIHEEIPIAYFSCMYEKGHDEVIIPLATQLRCDEDIAKYLSEYGYAPDKYKLTKVFNITETQYLTYCRNRHPKDPMKTDIGKDIKYYRILKNGSLLSYIGSRRTFKSDKAVLAYSIDMGKVDTMDGHEVEFDVPKEDYFLWKYGVKYGSKNVHYVASETYTDGRDPEYFAYMATKLKFTDIEQVKTHFVEMGKLSTHDIAEGITVEQCSFAKYKEAKKNITDRIKRLSTKKSESDAEDWEYHDDEEYEDEWS
jgi:hypothetical protein